MSAIQAFDHGKLVALPTETVYGLAAPINRVELIDKIYALKKRPTDKPLSVQVASINQAQSLTSVWTRQMQELAQKYWPGPLTMILPANDTVSDKIIGQDHFIGLRVPDHPIPLQLIQELDMPIAVPSANPHKCDPPKNAEDVHKYFSSDDVYIIDGGPCHIGQASTIVQIGKDDHIKLIREGPITL